MLSTKSVLGLVRNRAQADAVLTALLNTGFVRTDFSTLGMGSESTGALLHGLPRPVYTSLSAAIGAGIGGALGLLVGLGLLAIPGIGPLLAVGPVLATIASTFTGVAFGGITGSLVGVGVSEVRAKQYEAELRKGAILVSVYVDDRDQRAHARKVLRGYGATHLSTVGEVYAHRQLTHATS